MRELKVDIDDILPYLSNVKKSGSKHLYCDCPFCNKPKHFYINKENLLFDCKKCKEEGNAFKLLKQLGILNQFLHKSVNIKQLVKITTSEQQKQKEEEGVKKYIKKSHFFVRSYNDSYLLSRNWEQKDFYKYIVGRINKKRFEDYVVMYIEDDNGLLGYVARSLKSKEELEKLGKLRYMNSRETKFNELLFGFNEVTKDTEVVIIVEGIFDKVRLDNLLRTDDSDFLKVLCTFGNKVSNEQLNNLKTTNVNTVVLFYDLDAINEMKKNSVKLKKHFCLKIVCLLSGKDPGDATEEEVFEALSNPYNLNTFFYEKCNGRKIKV